MTTSRHLNLMAWTFAALFIGLCLIQNFCFADSIRFRQDNVNHELAGKVLVEASDGGVLFLDQAGHLWLVQPDEIESLEKVDEELPSIKHDALGEQIVADLPQGFKVETTDHWVIAYNTERIYAKYLGGLYERLYRGYLKYWKSKRKWEQQDPDRPLVAIIFSSFDEYARFVKKDLGIDPPNSMVAYYNLMTNRVVMYDLTSTLAGNSNTPQNDRQITEILSNPNALAMVATIIHEGTHQLMFNTGMQERLAATPVWVNEGLAMFFEVPDMRNNQGWRAIGQINGLRLTAFRLALQNGTRKENSLVQMLSEDSGFRDPAQLLDCYAEAWAFNYFLLNRYGDEFTAYLKFLSEKKPLIEDTAEKRLEDFKKFFDKPLEELDQEFVQYILRLQ
ncbi:MAG: DUF1570 domain-containing protein [Pirellulaceae bacterium]